MKLHEKIWDLIQTESQYVKDAVLVCLNEQLEIRYKHIVDMYCSPFVKVGLSWNYQYLK